MKIMKYDISMQKEIEKFFIKCFSDLGWDYEPFGEHSDIRDIQNIYMSNGCMWCMCIDNQLVGTVALKILDVENKIIEMKRLYILKEFQGNGYGNMLFETALNYAKKHQFRKIYADTAKDRVISRHILQKHGFNEIPKYEGCSLYTEIFYELNIY
jgi:N-acetylglutamate synthase-like GNAT family acetyltransferase